MIELPTDYRDFKDRYKGQTVYVVGSGATLNYIDPLFFADKICVCVNLSGMKLGLTTFYCITHYWKGAIELSKAYPNLPVITPDTDQGGHNLAPTRPDAPNVYMVPTNQQQYGNFDVDRDWPTAPDTFVVGPTSLHIAMNFAAYLVGNGGSIILAGADCGAIDGVSNLAGYPVGDNPFPVWAATLPKVADKLRGDGVGVYSLNPFVNLALEGHSYRGA